MEMARKVQRISFVFQKTHTIIGIGVCSPYNQPSSRQIKQTLEITFYWQPKLEGDADGNVNLFTQPQSSRDLDTPNGKIGLTTLSNPRRLKTGDKFTLTTDDPVNLPLPSFELLRLQFFLQRVCGMAGAAEALDLEGRSEDGWASDGAGLGLEDMEDWTWS